MNIAALGAVRLVIAPYNDISVALAQQLPVEVALVGFGDGSKTGPGIYPHAEVPPFDLVIVNSPNHWRAIAGNYPAEKVWLYKKLHYELISLEHYLQVIQQPLQFDVLLLPFNKSNTTDMAIVARELRNIGLSAALVDVGSQFDASIREGLQQNADVPVIAKDQVDAVTRRAVVASIDWEQGFGRPFLTAERARGGLTIGIVDGIEDFEDADYGYQRNAYNTVEYVFLMGSDDQPYLQHKRAKTSIIGLPKMFDLIHEAKTLPAQPLVMLNVNFTYGTFDDVRDNWVQDIRSVCTTLNVPYILSQHHADKGVFPPEIVSPDNVYDTIRRATVVISRFSTVILESLALGKQVIYYNPHQETVRLYKSPQGAYQIAANAEELRHCLLNALQNPMLGKMEAAQFLDRKCNISSQVRPGALAAHRIRSLLAERDALDLAPVETFAIDPRYAVRTRQTDHAAIALADLSQTLQNYLQAAGTQICTLRVGNAGLEYASVVLPPSADGLDLVSVYTQLLQQTSWRPLSQVATADFVAALCICPRVLEHTETPADLLQFLCTARIAQLLLIADARDQIYPQADPAFFGPPQAGHGYRQWTTTELQAFVSRYFQPRSQCLLAENRQLQLLVGIPRC